MAVFWVGQILSDNEHFFAYWILHFTVFRFLSFFNSKFQKSKFTSPFWIFGFVLFIGLFAFTRNPKFNRTIKQQLKNNWFFGIWTTPYNYITIKLSLMYIAKIEKNILTENLTWNGQKFNKWNLKTNEVWRKVDYRDIVVVLGLLGNFLLNS